LKEIKQPNIVYIILDTLREDRILSKYEGRELTPTLNNLLNNSIYFKNCISNYTWTVPSHFSTFTGLYAKQNSLLSNDPKKLSEKLPLITEILKNNGYTTLCYSENPWINQRTGLSKGFHTIYNNWKTTTYVVQKFKFYKVIKSIIYLLELIFKTIFRKSKYDKIWERIKIYLEKINHKIIVELFWRKILFERKDSLKVLDSFKENIEESKRKKKPLYLFFNIMATHNPYIIPIKYLEYFGVNFDDIKDMKDFLLDPIKYGLICNFFNDSLPEKKITKISKLYNACVSYSDLITEKILQILRDLNLLENTYVIISSDHGEHLASKSDHYFWNHAVLQSVYEPLIRVPLIIYNPNFNKEIIKKQVELKDVFFTILDLTNIKNSPSSLIKQKESSNTPKYIYGEYQKDKENILKMCSEFGNDLRKELIPKLLNNIYFIRTNYYKYIKYGNQIEELYEIRKDPNENTNIIEKNEKKAEELKEKMNIFQKNIKDLENIEKDITKQEKTSIRKGIKNLEFDKI